MISSEKIGKLWTDKYRPKTLKEILGNNKEKKIIESWVENWKNNICPSNSWRIFRVY